MKFREPIIFTPFEIKLGYVNYGGDGYWSQLPYNSSEIINNDLPIQLDSTQYQFNVINALTNRTGIIIETDLLRTNLPHYLIHQNYFDIQMGIGFQYAEFSSKTSLPSNTGTEWDISSSRGDYYFSPKSIGLNINTSLGWQFRPKRTSYIYYSFGLNKISLYESEGGDISLTGFGFSESFALGTKFILNQNNKNYRYTLGIETKWNRQYFSDLDYPEGLSPIIGIDIKSSGIFLTTGIQFGGNRTDGDLAYNDMLEQNFISAVENFEYFLAKERRHGKLSLIHI